MKVFEDLGLNPKVDDDGDVMVRFQMKNIYALIGDEEEKYVTLALPHFYDIDENELPLVFAVCNNLTRELKLCKVYVERTLKSVSAACEFFYTDEASARNVVENAMQVLSVLRTMFRKTKEELSSN